MAVEKKDRDDYERGRADRDLGWLDQAINDITVNHPDNEAYYKGRDGEQFDKDLRMMTANRSCGRRS